MTTTIQVATDREHIRNDIVTPAETARAVTVHNPPGLDAQKLMLLLVKTAAGRMADDTEHRIRLSDIRREKGMKNHDRASLGPLLDQLHAAIIRADDPERRIIERGGFLSRSSLDYRHEATGDVALTWTFGKPFRDLAAASCHWAILDRQTVFALTSRYAFALFQHVSSLANLDRISGKTFTVDELRQALGVPDGKMPLFKNLNQRALKPAIEDINRTSPRLELAATPNRIGRKVASVTVTWIERPPAEQRERKAELDRPSVGRRHRQDGTAERIVETAPRPSFPQSGSARFGVWQERHREANRGRPRDRVRDLNLTAEAFREWCGTKGIPPDHANIVGIWRRFCEGDAL